MNNYNTDNNYQLTPALSQIPEPTSRAPEREYLEVPEDVLLNYPSMGNTELGL